MGTLYFGVLSQPQSLHFENPHPHISWCFYFYGMDSQAWDCWVKEYIKLLYFDTCCQIALQQGHNYCDMVTMVPS